MACVFLLWGYGYDFELLPSFLLLLFVLVLVLLVERDEVVPFVALVVVNHSALHLHFFQS